MLQARGWVGESRRVVGRLSGAKLALFFFRKQALTIQPVAAWRQDVALADVHHPHAAPVAVVVCMVGT